MKIECPACAHKQTIAPVVCSGCNENFAGYLFRKYRKPLMSATTALIVGGYGGYKVTDKLREEVRYPLRAEYAIVEVCVNASAVPLPLRELAVVATHAAELLGDLGIFVAPAGDAGVGGMGGHCHSFISPSFTLATSCSVPISSNR